MILVKRRAKKFSLIQSGFYVLKNILNIEKKITVLHIFFFARKEKSINKSTNTQMIVANVAVVHVTKVKCFT